MLAPVQRQRNVKVSMRLGVFKKVQERGIEKKDKAVEVLAQTLFTSDIITEIPGSLPILQKVSRCVATCCYVATDGQS